MILQTPHTMSVDGDNAIIFGNECGGSSLTIFGEKQHLASFRTTGKRCPGPREFGRSPAHLYGF
jgi:hypothetical protein